MVSYLKPSLFSNAGLAGAARQVKPDKAAASTGGGAGGPSIKCSDCGKEVLLEMLGEHICTPSPTTPSEPKSSGILDRRTPARQPMDIKIDTQHISPPGDRLSPNPTSSVASTPISSVQSGSKGSYFPASAAVSRSASASSVTSVSTSGSGGSKRLPFFERYAQLVAPTSGASSPASSPSSPHWGTSTSGPSMGMSPAVSSRSLHRTPDTSPDQATTPAKYWLDPSSEAPSRPLPKSNGAKNLGLGFANSSKGLDSLLASGAFDDDDELPPAPTTNHSKTSAREPPRSNRDGRADSRPPNIAPSATPRTRSDDAPGSNSSSSSVSSRFKGVGLEGLMGDLMAEIDEEGDKKAGGKALMRNTVKPTRSPPMDDASMSFSAYGDEDEDVDLAVTPRPGDVAVLEDNPHSPASLLAPSDSISQYLSRSPETPRGPMMARAPQPVGPGGPKVCSMCNVRFDGMRKLARRSPETQPMCESCYETLYLPKCRKCDKPIKKGAVTDRVGKVLGKYHPSCFNCFKCSEGFPTGEFYVWERKPVCYRHYHKLAGTMCANESCNEGVEGPCVAISLKENKDDEDDDDSNENKRFYHPKHFCCSQSQCQNSLKEYHFVVEGKPLCEEHATQMERLKDVPRRRRDGTSIDSIEGFSSSRDVGRGDTSRGGVVGPPPPGGMGGGGISNAGRKPGRYQLPSRTATRAAKRRTVIRNVGPS